jgi:hypothetical protein
MSARAPTQGLALRVTDQETARVVAIHRRDGQIVGSGCLLDAKHILTCRHVVQAALPNVQNPTRERVYATLVGFHPARTFDTRVVKVEPLPGPQNDLALLRIVDAGNLDIQMVEFASPLRHSGKSYSVLGFPAGERQGRNVSGKLHAADANGLLQMDRGGALSVLGGFSGAPVWSPDLKAFIGLVVTELASSNVSWCIPSRRICEFYPRMRVRFRIPPDDRPVINDWDVDDPNIELFGTRSNANGRSLSARVTYLGQGWKKYRVDVTYKVNPRSRNPRGQLVNFITYPDFKRGNVDAYELFAEIDNGEAHQEFFPYDLFTVAAVGDAGDTALTLDLTHLKPASTAKKKK